MSDTTTDLYAAAETLLMPEPSAEDTNSVEDQDDDASQIDDDQDVADDTDLSDEDDADSSSSDDPDEEIADDDTNDQTDKTQLIPVLVDGKEEQWTLEQLKQSASGQGAINKRFQEAAEARKQLQAREEQLALYEQNVLQAFQTLQNGATLQPPTPPSDELLSQDPIGYLEADVRYKKEMAKYQYDVANLQAVQQQQVARTAEQRREFVEYQAKLLSEAIPEYGDPNKREHFAKSLIEVGKKYNFSPEEMVGVTDMRYVLALNDAKKYHDLMAQRKSAKDKVQQKPSTQPIRAGAKKVAEPASTARKKVQERLKRTGSIDDAISLIFNS